MLKLKLQYFGHLMQNTDSLEKTLMLGKTEGRRKGWQKMRCLDGIASPTEWTWVWVSSRSWWLRVKSGVHWVAKSWTRWRDWTEGNISSNDNLELHVSLLTLAQPACDTYKVINNMILVKIFPTLQWTANLTSSLSRWTDMKFANSLNQK